MAIRSISDKAERAPYKTIGLILGPVAALVLSLFFAPDDLDIAGRRTAAIAAWMAIWWATEAVPFAVTALLPMVFFPLLGVDDASTTASAYASPIIFLFLGGFIVALSIEQWGLHKRLALGVFSLVGTHARALIGGIMLSAGLISMWMANTATTLMLLPIAISIITVVHQSVAGLTDTQKRNFAIAVVLGLAYSATIGGVATIIGTPPNGILLGFMEATYGYEISFANWMMVGLPFCVILLPACWFILTHIAYPVNFSTSTKTTEHLAQLRRDLGPIKTPEIRIGLIFCGLALSWAFRQPMTALTGLTGLSDAGIALIAAVLVFIVPSGDKQQPTLITWDQAVRLPWGILIMFGGGLSLAAAVSSSGLAEWLGNSLSSLSAVHFAVLVLGAITLVIFLTELTSNMATTATFLPVMAALALRFDQDVLLLVVPVTMAASCAFMLPIATAPNAIAFSSNLITIPQMVRAGILLNLFAIALLIGISVLLVPHVFG